MKIYITRQIPLEMQQLMTNAGHEISMWEGNIAMTNDQIIEASKLCDALLTISQPLDADFFTACQHLKVVATNSVGFDHINIKKATEMGIPVGNTPGVLSKATADTAFLLMQMVARKAIFWHKEILADNWGFTQPFDHLGLDLQGKTLGIFGLGRIGFELARAAKGAFEMPILYHNRSRNEAAEADLGACYVSFEELLAQSDVISVHANLNSENKGIFNIDAFRQMKNTAIFINTARGGLHNEEDLLSALEQSIIAGTGLDVTNPEPMAADHPLLNREDAVVLPHIGSATIETRKAMLNLSIQNILAGLAGEKLPSCVNPDVYKRR